MNNPTFYNDTDGSGRPLLDLEVEEQVVNRLAEQGIREDDPDFDDLFDAEIARLEEEMQDSYSDYLSYLAELRSES